MPSKAFDQLRDALETAHGMAPVKAAVKEFAGQLGFDWFAYLSVCGPEIDTFSTYPRAWQGHYINKKYASIDPVVQEARRSERCFAWSE
ncbi:MAG: autoinducer binding domain-containing protein, partial [Parvibaculaceae bacterium]